MSTETGKKLQDMAARIREMREIIGYTVAHMAKLTGVTEKEYADVYNRWNEHFTSFLLLGAVLVLLAVSLSMSAARRVA